MKRNPTTWDSKSKRDRRIWNWKPKRQPWKWDEKKDALVFKINAVIKSLAEFKPLTVRQIYYQLVGAGDIPNTQYQYKELGKLIKWARIEKRIPWDDIEDRVRVYENITGWNDQKEYIEYQVSDFLNTYYRNLLQTQKKYIEVWVEKDALSKIFKRVCEDYTMPLGIMRGNPSMDFLHEYHGRIKENEGKDPVIILFTDHDPKGVKMGAQIQESLREMSVEGIRIERWGLWFEDLKDYRLPDTVGGLKVGRSKIVKGKPVPMRDDQDAKGYMKKFGKRLAELDAIKPRDLMKRIERAIKSEIDMSLYDIEKDKEIEDNGAIDNKRDLVVELLEGS